MRRSSLALLVVLACTPAVEADELVPPDEPADPADLLTQPDERAAAPRHPEPDPRFTSCAALLGDATGQVRRDLQALCRATGMGPCNNATIYCDPSPAYEALGCLLEAGERERVVALSRADNPATRGLARKAMRLSVDWTPEQIELALGDDVRVPDLAGCTSGSESLADQGLEAALHHPERAALRPVLRQWLRSRPDPERLERAIEERGDEGWIEDDE
ncbi:MAG: hypothetical protein KDK70_30365, partial [Myxococcales bacterium]|nr:hypothetical protein [Myxococcales bacterium]